MNEDQVHQPIIGYVSVTLIILSLAFINIQLFSVKLKSDRQLSMCMTIPIKLHVHPGKTKISLGIFTQWEAKDPCILNADCEDWSDKATADMPKNTDQLLLIDCKLQITKHAKTSDT